MKYLCGLVFCFIAGTAAAQNICGPREELILRLWDKWQEVQVAYGLIDDDRVLEVFVAKNGSWTAIVTDASGKSCVVSAGKNWTVVDPIYPSKKEQL